MACAQYAPAQDISQQNHPWGQTTPGPRTENREDAELTYAMVQNISPTMDGTIVAIGVSFIICVVWTLIAPEKDGNYDAYKTIQLEDCEDLPSESEEDPMAMNRALKVHIHPIHKCNACSAEAPCSSALYARMRTGQRGNACPSKTDRK